ncbi:hypothetical protein GLOIN_2v1842500 [Rhizophagus clarus]|uniref:Uncharacterized protein n=1 Tax=Rhizophagus clarus TaxID=94130 RepID=A0A8H3LEQ9_9GLOM|nr:hypothetical protein GLOIN_2v1842500 [Rhizophagus clarus]
MIQRYAIAQRLQVEFDQLSVANHSSSSESSSSRLSDSSLEENRHCFKRVFNSNREGDSLDYMFETKKEGIVGVLIVNGVTGLDVTGETSEYVTDFLSPQSSQLT